MGSTSFTYDNCFGSKSKIFTIIMQSINIYCRERKLRAMQQIDLPGFNPQSAIDAGLEYIKNLSPDGVKNVSRIIQALSLGNADPSRPSVYVGWLIKEKRDDHWETDSVLLDTARAVSALASYGIIFPDVSRWLLKQQLDDGSWNNNLTETAYVLIALGDVKEKNTSGCRWLAGNPELTSTGTIALSITALCKHGFNEGDFIAENVELLKQRQLADCSWKSLAISNMVAQALFAAGEKKAALSAVPWILSRQREDGSWKNKSDNTALTLITLKMITSWKK